MLRDRFCMSVAAAIFAAASFGAQAQTASGKFTCDAETYTVESAVAAWVPGAKMFYVWALAGKFSDEELKALAFAEGGRNLKTSPKAMSDKGFQKAASDAQTRKRSVKHVMMRGYLKDNAARVDWKNVDGATLMYVNCLKNENLNFSMRPGEKDPNSDITKAFKSFDFPLKDGAKVKYQTIAFKHAANPKGISTSVTWDYKVDTRVYVIE